MMRRASAFLFDLDGTLVDSTAAVTSSYRQALREAGVEIGEEEFRTLSMGRHWSAFLPAMLAANGSVVDPATIAARKNEIYFATLSRVALNMPLLRLIGAVRGVVPTGLVTTASRAAVMAIVAHFELGDYFDVVITGDDVTSHKPDPEGYLLAASQLGVAPGECVVFEDTAAGIESARRAGMDVVSVSFATSA